MTKMNKNHRKGVPEKDTLPVVLGSKDFVFADLMSLRGTGGYALLRAGGQHDCVGAGDNHLMAD